MDWHIKYMIMKFLPPRNKRRMSDCYWHKRPRCIDSCAALVLEDPLCLYGLLDILSGLEEFMKK
jgi:hypothetical protein